MTETRDITRIVIALVFIVSGLAKLVDVSTFIELAEQYIPSWPAKLAGTVPTLELVWGCCLLLRYRTATVAAALATFTTVLTAIFTYGLFFKGITDCGCFGSIAWLALPPWGVYLRNGLLLAGLLWLWQAYPGRDTVTGPLKAAVLAIAGGAALFMTGSSLHEPLWRGAPPASRLLHHSIAGTALAGLGLSADSTYALFIFSPACPHCWDATPNVISWRDAGLVDAVVGITAASFAERAEAEYLPWYGDDFDGFRVLPNRGILSVADNLPLVVVVRHDTVIHVQGRRFPSGYRIKYFNRRPPTLSDTTAVPMDTTHASAISPKVAVRDRRYALFQR